MCCVVASNIQGNCRVLLNGVSEAIKIQQRTDYSIRYGGYFQTAHSEFILERVGYVRKLGHNFEILEKFSTM